MSATQTGGGLSREVGEIFLSPLLNATSLSDGGFVLKQVTESSIEKVDLCGATDIPYAVNYRSTRNPHDLNAPPTSFMTGSNDALKGGIPIFREGWAYLLVANNNAAMTRGDPVKVASGGGGKIDKYVPTTIRCDTVAHAAADTTTRFVELARMVGHVEEDVPAGGVSNPGKTKALVRLCIRNTGLTG